MALFLVTLALFLLPLLPASAEAVTCPYPCYSSAVLPHPDTLPGGSKVLHLDDFYLDDGATLDDPGDIRVTAKLPDTVTNNNFGTVGGTGAVNERPLSETNYVERPDAAPANQSYTLQAAAAGDVDISGDTIVGYMGWIRAKATTGSVGTPAITVNGSDTGVTLTTAYATYTHPVASGSYPSSSSAIGMTSTGAGDDTFLAECGIVVGYTAGTPPASTVRHRVITQ